MATASNTNETNDLGLVAELNFTDVEKFIAQSTASTGKTNLNKGYKYFSENYIFSIKIWPMDNGCMISSKCHRSMRKNESPHNSRITIKDDKDIVEGMCSCANGLSGACGHVVAILYKIADLKKKKFQFIPEDVARTSEMQKWHEPRGEKLLGQPLKDINFVGYKSNDLEKKWTVDSTLYNPLTTPPKPPTDLAQALQECNVMFNFAISKENVPYVKTTMGKFPKGSPLSYQLQMDHSLINIRDAPSYPPFPIKNVMGNISLSFALSKKQQEKFTSLQVTSKDAIDIEIDTQLQSMDPKWHKIRNNRITASVVGDVAKRRNDFEKLAKRLQSQRYVMTKAMKNGIENEPLAVDAYNKVMGEKLNIYKSGVVIHPTAYWLAASPDRKVYDPTAVPTFGLLEVKCPYLKNRLEELPYIEKIGDEFKLKQGHNYYFQIQMQMAVTGTEWCDLFVWGTNFHHLERICFNEPFWKDVKQNVDLFFFNYFL